MTRTIALAAVALASLAGASTVQASVPSSGWRTCKSVYPTGVVKAHTLPCSIAQRDAGFYLESIRTKPGPIGSHAQITYPRFQPFMHGPGGFTCTQRFVGSNVPPYIACWNEQYRQGFKFRPWQLFEP